MGSLACCYFFALTSGVLEDVNEAGHLVLDPDGDNNFMNGTYHWEHHFMKTAASLVLCLGRGGVLWVHLLGGYLFALAFGTDLCKHKAAPCELVGIMAGALRARLHRQPQLL